MICLGIALWKGGVRHARKKSSQISLCSPHMLIRNDTFRFYMFRLKKVSSKKKSNVGGECRPWLACADFVSYMRKWFLNIYL